MRLPNQRLNDYSVLLQELVNYGSDLGDSTADLEKALELMKILPQKSGDDKFLKSIEGYRGSIKGLGRLLSHVIVLNLRKIAALKIFNMIPFTFRIGLASLIQLE